MGDVLSDMANKGRPPHEDPSEVKREMIGVRVNQEEKAELEWAAREAGFKKVGTWLRSLGVAAAKRMRKKTTQ